MDKRIAAVVDRKVAINQSLNNLCRRDQVRYLGRSLYTSTRSLRFETIIYKGLGMASPRKQRTKEEDTRRRS